jgi:YVTN family beta-propeller protein
MLAPTLRRLIVPLTAAGLLASCGGGGGAPEGTPSADAARKRTMALFTPSTPIPADAGVKGMWGPVTAWPLIPVHTVVMPDGRLMTFGTKTDGTQTGYFVYDVWDPELGFGTDSHQTLDNQTLTDIFCSSQLLLPSGDAVFIAGGDNWTGTGTTNTGNNNANLFSAATNTLTRQANMNRARWYSSATTLLNGETYIQGGSGGTDRPEVRQADGSFRLLSGANTSSLDFMYPRNFVGPDGLVFGYDSAGRMYRVDPAGTGSITSLGQFNSAYTGSDASAAMFRPGRILQFGGNSNNAVVIDIRGATPTVTPSQPMSSQRRLGNATILADGKVLATGGSPVWNSIDNASYHAEIWNPETGTWTIGANGVRSRLYHSGAVLLPDASVLVVGGGAPGPQNNTNVELYFPPYLFTAAGTLAPRPAIDAAPTVLNIGSTFNVDISGGGAARVVLVKTSSVTHSWNMDQRFVELTFNANGNRLAVQGPTRAADAPPGFYMLFVLDANGVPSQAKILRVNVAPEPNPSITPALAGPGDQSTEVGTPATLQLQATDPNGDTLAYTATGLPPGMAIDTATGTISGTPTSAGTFDVVVAASDGVNAASVSFAWVVTDPAAFVLSVPVLPAATATGGVASFTAAANGTDPQYKWDFGDGTPETAWSSSPTATHTYTQPGLYNVTVTARDMRGIELRQTVLQAIHLPLAAGRPAASANIAFEQPTTGGARVWVVNQDNDSVSVFDATTGARLAEIGVGTAPRTLAVAPTGMVWVTNKLSATISVIDPATLAVSRTLNLARGSQPFGVAVSAAGQAFVVLEAGGQLLRFDTSTYAQTGALAIGARARHVGIAADGGTAYVTRFITPPLAGESTAAPQPQSGGGEVLAIDTAAMSLLRTTTLAHGDKPDAENQGRGLPNYLGAAVVSPDGSTAWVPSKQDNVLRGTLRDGLPLNFQNTVRAISSRIDLTTGVEDLASRIDHDNASLASAAAFDPLGIYLFVALETSREVAVVDAHGRRELFRFAVGLAPQGLALSADGRTLAVNNFMARTVGLYDLTALVEQGLSSVTPIATLGAVSADKLAATVLRGKQLFYDARDTRLARDGYMSCASCHSDGGHDGRVWDLTGAGEGLRNTIALRGRGGMAHGGLHWSNNFDEVQDFEGQIRTLAGGTGLMSDADFVTGTRSQPLGDAKAGRSADLDALAAYVASLNSFEPSPTRPGATTLSAAASEGRARFAAMNCAACHGGGNFTTSGAGTLSDIGTVKPTSGGRLGGALAGIDVPTLRDVWATAPYLHDGSAATLEDAVRAHRDVSVTDADLTRLAAYLREIGSDESAAPSPAGSGSGLTGSYFNNVGLSGSAVLTRTEAVDFGWGSGSPASGVVNTNNFSVRWSGTFYAATGGTYRFQTVSDDGVRLWVNGVRVINNWSDHSATTNTSGNVTLSAGQFYTISMEYYEKSGQAVARLRWRLPGTSSYVAIPKGSLYPQ